MATKAIAAGGAAASASPAITARRARTDSGHLDAVPPARLRRVHRLVGAGDEVVDGPQGLRAREADGRGDGDGIALGAAVRRLGDRAAHALGGDAPARL